MSVEGREKSVEKKRGYTRNGDILEQVYSVSRIFFWV